MLLDHAKNLALGLLVLAIIALLVAGGLFMAVKHIVIFVVIIALVSAYVLGSSLRG